MNLYQCQKRAEEIGFDKAKFVAIFPAGIFHCQWLDAYMGMLKIDVDGMRDGFVMVDEIDKMYPNLIVSEPFVEE